MQASIGLDIGGTRIKAVRINASGQLLTRQEVDSADDRQALQRIIQQTSKSLAEEDMEIMDGVFWGANFEALKLMLENNNLDPENFRFFIGYSGWGEGQLERELDQKSWFVTSANKDIVFSENTDQMWKAVLKSMGGSYSFLANSPGDPQWN